MPEMLKAEYTERGPVPQDVIQPVPMELDAPGDGEALVAVLASPINPSDVLTLTGEYGMLPDLPAIGGNEGVGRVVSVGADADGSLVGRMVMLPPGIGTWRTHLVADTTRLTPVPDDTDPLQMSMVTVNPPTAALLLSEFVELGPGDWLIQNAANSGVGGYLIRLAAEAGIRTVNVVRRESAVEDVRTRGGDVCIVDGPGLRDRVFAATDGVRPRLGIDAVGGTATGRLASTLERGGTLVNYGAMSGEPCVVPPLSLVFGDITVRGFWLLDWFRRTDADRRRSLVGRLAGMVADGRLEARIAATYPVARIAEAVEHAASGHRDGKVLVVPEHD